MLNHSIFTYFIAQGQHRAGMRNLSAALPSEVAFCAGVPFIDGRAVYSLTLPVTHHHNGMPFCGNSALAAENAPATQFAQGGLGITAQGRLAIALDGEPVHNSGGFPMTGFGQICVPAADPPLNLHAFSLGFDPGAFA